VIVALASRVILSSERTRDSSCRGQDDLGRVGPGQSNYESATVTWLAFGGDRAAVCRGDAPCDGRTQIDAEKEGYDA
jgi:hypothetical protein